MLELHPTSKFKKDVKRLMRRGEKLTLLDDIITKLQTQNGALTPDEMKLFRDHELEGKFHKSRELHIQDDWLLVYRVDKDKLILTAIRTGTHSDIFDN